MNLDFFFLLSFFYLIQSNQNKLSNLEDKHNYLEKLQIFDPAIYLPTQLWKKHHITPQCTVIDGLEICDLTIILKLRQ